ncbi:hypothetical protein Pve01_69350 [Planomonospora venezuelensis]|nr:hypothetical protein Pve01_69350 [Planomonospora venezuelensis]
MLFFTAGSAGSASTADQPCVPSEAWTETTDWVLQSPGAGWRQVDERTVTDQPAWTEEVFVGWQHYSWTGGPLEAGVVPAVPTGPDDPDWQANTTHEPHTNNPHVTWLDGTGWGLHYTSHGGSGLADWFYLERLTEVVEHPAVTHQEYRYAFDHPAVVCPTAPPTTQPPTTQPPTVQPPTAQPPEVLPTTATPSATPSAEPSEPAVEEPAEEVTQQPTTQQPTTQPDDAEVLGVQASEPPAPSAQVPTAVDAGLPAAPDAGTTATTTAAQQWGVVLTAMGLVLLASAGGVLVRVRQD